MANYTKEEQLKLVNDSWRNLENIDNQYEEVCLVAVKQCGWALEYMREQTEDICLNAVKNYGKALQYVKEQTVNICLEAVKNHGQALKYVQKQTTDICLEAVKQDGRALQYVEEQTSEICIAAVKNYGEALEYVIEQTEEICMEAVRQDGEALRYVHEQTYDICLEAVKQNGEAIRYIGKNFLNKKSEIYEYEKFLIYLYSYLTTSSKLDHDTSFIKRYIDYHTNKNILNKKVFFLYNSFDFDKYFNDNQYDILDKLITKCKINCMENEKLKDYEFLKLDIYSLYNSEDYLINSCYDNYFFIHEDMYINDETIKNIALSNNKLIVLKDSDSIIKPVYAILANKILTEEELLQESF